MFDYHGIIITQNEPLFTSTTHITSNFTDVTDELYEEKVNNANLCITFVKDGLTLACNYFLPIRSKIASFAVGKVTKSL